VIRAGRPAWPWRLLAWIQFGLCGLITVFALWLSPLSSLGLILPTWITIGGLLAYAYGRPARPLLFWRIFAILLSFHLMWDLGDDLARFPVDLGHNPGTSGGHVAIFLFSVPLNIFTCIGMLRHAKLLRKDRHSANRDLEEVFA
jgi:hypothetical protein